MPDEFFPAVVLWLYNDPAKGGCLCDIGGQTWLFKPTFRDRFGSMQDTYQSGWTPTPGQNVSFKIDFGHTCNWITSLAPLSDAELWPEDLKTLENHWQEYERQEFVKSVARKPQTRSFERTRKYER